MTAVVTGTTSSFRLKLSFSDDEGNTKVKTKSYSNVKPASTNDNILEVGYKIAQLMDDNKYTFQAVVKVVNTELSA